MGIEERRQRERERRRAAIIRAATRDFAERGVDGASMGTIARGAELAKASLYYYFPTKEALYQAVMDEGTEAFFASLPAPPPQGEDLPEAVEALLRGYLSFFREQPHLHRVLASSLVHAMGAAWTPGAAHDPQAPQPPAHLAFMHRLGGLVRATPWRHAPQAFHAFLADVLIALSQRILAGQHDLEAALAFYLRVIRHPPFESTDTP